MAHDLDPLVKQRADDSPIGERRGGARDKSPACITQLAERKKIYTTRRERKRIYAI